MSDVKTHFVVVGGGIGGVSCAKNLHYQRPDSKITLISATTLVKTVLNLKEYGKNLQEFEVKETPGSELERQCPNVSVVNAEATEIHADRKVIRCGDGNEYAYDKLCLCSGGTPKLMKIGDDAEDLPVIGIRDLESVVQFQARLNRAKRIIIVGNGGISMELVYDITGCEIVWAIRHDSIGNSYFDSGAAQFLVPRLFEGVRQNVEHVKRQQFESEVVHGVAVYTGHPRGGSLDHSGVTSSHPSSSHGIVSGPSKGPIYGSALGPDWKETLRMKGSLSEDKKTYPLVVLEYCVEVEQIISPATFRAKGLRAESFKTADASKAQEEEEKMEWSVYVLLSNGHYWGADFIVNATGVTPVKPRLIANSNASFKVAEDGGLIVDEMMRTNVDHIFAAGDACHAGWKFADNWFQMRLWSQARQMGIAASRAMVADVEGTIENLSQDFCFECFTHVTKFFNYKCVLLGRYNGQGLKDYNCIVRTTPGVEYIKLVVVDDRIQGAIFIGETDLEETFENLILNQLDIGRFGENILYPGIDIEDYFD